MTKFLPRVLAFALVCAAALAICALRAAPQVAVRHSQGILHGFLIGRSEDGEAIAAGGLSQIARGERVTVHTELHFKDGSLQDETTVYSQRGRLALVSDHMIQRGPQFKRPMEMTVVRASGRVTVNYADDDGNNKTATETMSLPLDLANGIVPTLLQEVAAGTPKILASMVVAAPKPRLVKLTITPQGDKQPPDSHVWIAQGEAPILVKSEGSLFEGGPIWRIELASPVWPKGGSEESKEGR